MRSEILTAAAIAGITLTGCDFAPLPPTPTRIPQIHRPIPTFPTPEPTKELVKPNLTNVIFDLEGKKEMEVPSSESVNFNARGFILEAKGVKIQLPLSGAKSSVILASKGKPDSSSRVELRIDYQLEAEGVRRRVLARLPSVTSENTCETVTMGENATFINGNIDQSFVSKAKFTEETHYKLVVDGGKVSIFVNGILYSEQIHQVSSKSCTDNENWMLVEGDSSQNSSVQQINIGYIPEQATK